MYFVQNVEFVVQNCVYCTVRILHMFPIDRSSFWRQYPPFSWISFNQILIRDMKLVGSPLRAYLSIPGICLQSTALVNRCAEALDSCLLRLGIHLLCFRQGYLPCVAVRSWRDLAFRFVVLRKSLS